MSQEQRLNKGAAVNTRTPQTVLLRVLLKPPSLLTLLKLAFPQKVALVIQECPLPIHHPCHATHHSYFTDCWAGSQVRHVCSLRISLVSLVTRRLFSLILLHNCPQAFSTSELLWQLTLANIRAYTPPTRRHTPQRQHAS
jgi:hypothetical protein